MKDRAELTLGPRSWRTSPSGSEFIDGEDLLQGSHYDGQGIIHGAGGPEPDKAVGSDEYRAVTGDLDRKSVV